MTASSCAPISGMAERTALQGRRLVGYRVAATAVALAFFPLFVAIAAVEPVTPSIAAADAPAGAARGEKLAIRCKACHAMDKGGASRFGPPLWDVVGRRKASVPGFRYSPAFQKLDGVWDYESINALIASPNAVAPGTRMKYPGVRNVAERTDLILYLRSLSDDPAPLPPSSPGTTREASRPGPAAPAIDEDFEGLPAGAGREEVFYLCAACHSLKLVTQQGLPRYRWDELLTWMTEKQGMPELDGTERSVVLDYLAEHYGIPVSRPTMTPLAPPPMMPLPSPPK